MMPAARNRSPNNSTSNDPRYVHSSLHQSHTCLKPTPSIKKCSNICENTRITSLSGLGKYTVVSPLSQERTSPPLNIDVCTSAITLFNLRENSVNSVPCNYTIHPSMVIPKCSFFFSSSSTLLAIVGKKAFAFS